MTENEIIVLKSVSELPIQHQLGKLIFGTLVGFAATKGAEKLYEVILEISRHRAARR